MFICFEYDVFVANCFLMDFFFVQTKELLEFYFGDSNLFKDGFRVQGLGNSNLFKDGFRVWGLGFRDGNLIKNGFSV